MHSPSFVETSNNLNANLPLIMDPALAQVNSHQPKRHLGDNFSQKVKMRANCFVTTVDSKFLIGKCFLHINENMASFFKVILFNSLQCLYYYSVRLLGPQFPSLLHRDWYLHKHYFKRIHSKYGILS